jgi:multiple sugar transport system substrate-binding protein
MRALLTMLVALLAAGQIAYAQVTVRLMDTRLSEEPSRSSLTRNVEAFMKAHPQVKVQLESVKSSDMLTKFLISSEANQAPDVVYLYAGMLSRVVERDYLLPLGPFVSAEPAGFLDRFYPMAMDAVTHDGKVYALPTIVSVYGWWVNRDSLRAAGLDENKAPETWDDFLAASKKLTRARKGGSVDQWAIALVGKSRSAVQRLAPWFFTNDVRLLNDDHTVFLPDRDRARESFKFVVELYTKQKVIPPGPTGVGAADIRIMFANETVNMTYDGPYAAMFHKRENPNMTEDRQVVWPFPGRRKRAEFASVNWLGISSQTKHPKEAWQLISYLTEKESSVQFSKDTGFLSATVAANNAPEILSDRLTAGFVRNVPSGVLFPEDPRFPQLGDLMVEALQNALVEKMTPEQAFDQLVAKADQVLKSK